MKLFPFLHFFIYFFFIALIPKAQLSGNINLSMVQDPLISGHLYGKIIADGTGKPITTAAIQLLKISTDSISGIKSSVVVAIVMSDKKGSFDFDSFPYPVLGIRISALGYKMLEGEINFAVPVLLKSVSNNEVIETEFLKDLGSYKLFADSSSLENLTVTANRPVMQMFLDRKIYNVDRDLTAVGGTALDILKKVPSVISDADGNLSMRNAVPQIFVDGRPTTLTPDQIPANQVATVEVITNPSSKYDAGSGAAGILNIVLKKNRLSGYNGNLRTSIDSRGRPMAGGDINYKFRKMNVSFSGMLNSRKSISKISNDRTEYFDNYEVRVDQNNNPVAKGLYSFGRLGFDYVFNNNNSISVNSNLFIGRINTKDQILINRDSIFTTTLVTQNGIRNLKAVTNLCNFGNNISFKHVFPESRKEWTVDAQYNYNNTINTSDYRSTFSETPGHPGYQSAERSSGGGDVRNFTLQTDYVDPLGKTGKNEMGLRFINRSYHSNNDNFLANTSGQFIFIPALHVQYEYNDIIFAGYANISRQVKKTGIQLGLRVEGSSYNGKLITKNKTFSNSFPFSIFPSLFITQKLSEKSDVQFNYSRKIYRPNFFQLIPFIDFSDSLNLSVGNPQLVPEFTQLLECTYMLQGKAGQTLLVSAYGRNTNNLISRYQFREADPNPLKNDSVIFNSYTNAKSSFTAGIEITGKQKLKKYWDMNLNFNLFHASVNVGDIPGTANNNGFSWFARMNNYFTFISGYTFMLSCDYQAKNQVPLNSGQSGAGGGALFGNTAVTSLQGFVRPFFGTDIAVRKDFLKHKAVSITLQLNDVFRSRKYQVHTATGLFIQDYSRLRDPQLARLNFNWHFGKKESPANKRKSNNADPDLLPGL